MRDEHVDREWLLASGERFYLAVIAYRDEVRRFCTEELGMSWEIHRRDANYFAERMRKAREEKRKRAERLRALIPRRQCWVAPLTTQSSKSSEAEVFLSELVAKSSPIDIMDNWSAGAPPFDLKAAQDHILIHLPKHQIDIKELPQFLLDARRDLICKFIAAIFLRQEGTIVLSQEKSATVMIARASSCESVAGARA